MRLRRPKVWAIAAMLLMLAAYVAWAAFMAQRDLVTLNVRDMEVRKVIAKIERQTHETIVAGTNVNGKVTLNVRRAPLEHVLHMIGEQTSSRYSKLYPLYAKSTSLNTLRRALKGELDAAFVGWTNLTRRGLGGPFGGRPAPGFGRDGGFFGEIDTNVDSVVSLNIRDKDVHFAAAALSRFGGVRVVPEDKVHKSISLRVDQVPIESAVARLAKAAGVKWYKIYALRGDDGPRQFADRRGGFRDMSEAEREEMRQQREAANEEMMQMLSAEERAKLEEARKEREKFFQEMQNLTPEQRRERFEQFGAAIREQRNLDRIKNTTPEQRLERYREMNERRKRWQEARARGEAPPGGPRRGPRGFDGPPPR